MGGGGGGHEVVETGCGALRLDGGVAVDLGVVLEHGEAGVVDGQVGHGGVSALLVELLELVLGHHHDDGSLLVYEARKEEHGYRCYKRCSS